MAVMLSLTVVLLVWRNPAIAPRATDLTIQDEKWRSLRSVIPVLLLALAVLGSIYAGIATPSEAGAVGALGALVIAALLGALKAAVLKRILGNTARTTAMFILLIIGGPVFFPAVTALGYDPVWFGIVMTINIEIAAISPPVGFNLFVLKTVIPDSRMGDIIQGSLVFIVPLALGILGLIAWPEIALWLPRLMMN
jgi:C4-dicarboxylate transporter DctM subunit